MSITNNQSKAIRWDHPAWGKLGQHTIGRAEALGKTIFYTGLVVGQIAKIAAKSLMVLVAGGTINKVSDVNEDTGTVVGGKYTTIVDGTNRSINPFSLESFEKDLILLAGFASSIFTRGLCGVIFAPKSTSVSLLSSVTSSGRVFLNAFGEKGGVEASIYSPKITINIVKKVLPKVPTTLKAIKSAIYSTVADGPR